MTRSYSRILVTGGAGFIGSHIVDRLLSEGFEVTVIDNLDAGCLKNLEHNQNRAEFHFVKGDIRDWDLVKKAMKDIDAVFHEAALVSVVLSVQNPVVTNEINVSGTLNLLKAASDFGVERFIYASSAAVYGEIPKPREKEELIPNPTSPYGVSKFAAEKYTRLFYKVYGLKTVSLRYFNVFGPRQSFDILSQYGGVITTFLNRLLENKSPIIYGDGEQTRDFVYVQDIVEANMLALHNKNAFGELFNIGSGKSISVNQVTETLKALTNKKTLKNTYTDPKPGDIRHSCADISKAQKVLGYNPKFSFEEGLIELIKWHSNNANFPSYELEHNGEPAKKRVGA